jgi:hypothetical protein
MTTDSYKRGGGGKGCSAALTSSSLNPLRCHCERSEESPYLNSQQNIVVVSGHPETKGKIFTI